MASSSKGWITESSASESEPSIPVMEAARTDEILPEVAATARFLLCSLVELALPLRESWGTLLLRRLRWYHLLVIP